LLPLPRFSVACNFARISANVVAMMFFLYKMVLSTTCLDIN
jgi:hypothetical protein